MKKNELESFLKKFSKKAYELAYTLIPDDLQASQIVVDATTNFILTEMDWLHCAEIDGISKSEESFLKKDFYLLFAREIYQLGIKRLAQLPVTSYPLEKSQKAFYSMTGVDRVLVYLKYKENLSLEELTLVTGKKKAEVINALFQGNGLLEAKA